MSGGDHGVSSEDRQRTAADPICTEVWQLGALSLLCGPFTSAGILPPLGLFPSVIGWSGVRMCMVCAEFEQNEKAPVDIRA